MTQRQLLKKFLEEKGVLALKTIGELMKPADTISPSASVVEAVKRLQNSESGFFVVTDGRKVEGILTGSDLFEAYYHYVACHYPSQRFREHYTDLTQYFERKKFIEENKDEFAKKTVADVMNPRPKVVQADVQVAEAIELLKTFDLKRLTVVDGEGNLLGTVDRLDLLLEELE
ncbi:MAG: CBS domain-containing protein [Candidatus Micrarchaeota archaeon]